MAAGCLVYSPPSGRTSGRSPVVGPAQVVRWCPLLFLEALNLHVASVVALARRRDRGALIEALLLGIALRFFVVHRSWCCSPASCAVFVVVIQSLFGFYLGMSFLTNHVGMPPLAAGTTWGSSGARSSPPATCPVGRSSGSSSGGSTARSSTTCSRPCPGPTSGGPGDWSTRSAPAPDRLHRAEPVAGLPRGGAPPAYHRVRRRVARGGVTTVGLSGLVPPRSGRPRAPRSRCGRRSRPGPRRRPDGPPGGRWPAAPGRPAGCTRRW